MPLTVLNVAYPLAPVGPGAVGGAEQVVMHLDAALTEAGHHSIVVACEGSETQGTLVATPHVDGPLDRPNEKAIHARHRAAIEQVLDQWTVDVVHMHGLDFHRYLPPPGVPVLVTLHLPPGWYPSDIWRLDRPATYLHCVSTAQHRSCPAEADLLPVIENGVPIPRRVHRRAERDFVLTMGRICPEKGFHLALDAATRAGMACTLAGRVFPYEAHERYFREEIQPRLTGRHRHVGAVGTDEKRRLLMGARAVLVPSLVPETSSLVAMEALACGTPVIAFPAGALSEIVDDGSTGFLVRDVEEMATAIERVDEIDAEACRKVARDRFSLDKMTNRYLGLYHELTHRPRNAGPAVRRADTMSTGHDREHSR